jgi:hypothetical protein
VRRERRKRERRGGEAYDHIESRKEEAIVKKNTHMGDSVKITQRACGDVLMRRGGVRVHVVM